MHYPGGTAGKGTIGSSVPEGRGGTITGKDAGGEGENTRMLGGRGGPRGSCMSMGEDDGENGGGGESDGD